MRSRAIVRVLVAAALGLSSAVLVSCGESGKGLIPTANSTPLQSDFEEVARTAIAGHGSCTATTTALEKTELDFQELPASVDAGLHSRLAQGISNLRKRALEVCEQPQVTSTTSTASSTTSSTQSVTTTTQSAPVTTTSSSTTETVTASTTASSLPGGGTPANEGPEGAGPGTGKEPGAQENGANDGPSGGTGQAGGK
ncbi:MAG TPA: hypothetical protein VID48_07510 [Solirubrobacteraceae bacterium]